MVHRKPAKGKEMGSTNDCKSGEGGRVKIEKGGPQFRKVLVCSMVYKYMFSAAPNKDTFQNWGQREQDTTLAEQEQEGIR